MGTSQTDMGLAQKRGEFLQGSQEITIGVIDAPALQIDLAALGSGIWGHTERQSESARHSPAMAVMRGAWQ